MTDRPPSDVPGAPDDLPEADPIFGLASALHDGEATDAERARGDAEVQRDLRVVGAVSRRVAEVPPAPDGLAADQVAAALAAFDEIDAVPPAEVLAAGAAPDGSGPRVTSLAARRRWWQRAPLGAVAAGVAAVALVGAVGFAAVGDGDDDADTASTAFESDDAESGTDAVRTEDAEASATAGAAGAAGGPDAYATFEELAAALEDRAATAARGDETTAEETAEAAPDADALSGTEDAAGCDAVGTAAIDPASIELVVGVVVDGQLVTAVVHALDGERRLTSVDEATCAVVDRRPL
jgi:hypothetical protein